MKKNTLKRIAAIAASCAVMCAAMPIIPSAAEPSGNLISNSTFEDGPYDWGVYKESGGVGSVSTEDGKLALTVTKQGKLGYAVQLYYDIIPLYKNGVYRFKFDISSTVDRVVEAMIQQNGGTYQSYIWNKIEVTKEPKSYEFVFTMGYPTDIMSKMCFNCGIQEEDGELPVHKVFLDNVSLELIDDSEVDYDAGKPYEPDILVNQIGFRPEAPKSAVFRNDSGKFNVVNAETKETVFTGDITGKNNDKTAGETNYIGDFSELKTAGKYYITAEAMDDSYTFEIGGNVYSDMLNDSVRMFYLQRCGCEIEDEKFGHVICHDSEATIYKTNKTMDVSGGWHDAGDYGRYTVAGAKAVADLLYAYQTEPGMFTDEVGIPESGNGIPDILDEVRYELEWMLKMQDAEDGGVYHKVTCENFPGYIMPEKEVAPLIVMPKSTTATADFAASMAMAYEFYKEYDAEFAEKCLDSAKKAWKWVKENPKVLYSNPLDVVTGEYGDRVTSDEIYWAAAQLSRATGDDSYLEGIATKTGLDWSTVGDYGNIALLTSETADKSSEIYKNAAAAVIEQADELLATTMSNNYGVALSSFHWGSNMTIANAGIIMALAYDLTGNDDYMTGANKQLNYLLGQNSNGASFVTGYGTVSPEAPHHRPSMAVGEAMIGMLVGGVNQNLEDSAAKAYCKYNAPARCWIDNAESYSTNEITIYWNSPLVYLLAMTEKTKAPAVVEPPVKDGVWGDANVDGKLTVADAAAVLQYLGNADKYPLSDDGKLLADVYMNGDGVTTSDAAAIQKMCLKLVSKLPVSFKEDSTETPYDEKAFFTLTMNEKPTKLEYKVGEKFDISGATFSGAGMDENGVNFDIFDSPADKLDLTIDDSDFDSTNPGTYTICISMTMSSGLSSNVIELPVSVVE